MIRVKNVIIRPHPPPQGNHSLKINAYLLATWQTAYWGLGGYRNLKDIKCCKVDNSIIHLLQSNSSVITQCRKLNIRPVSKSFAGLFWWGSTTLSTLLVTAEVRGIDVVLRTVSPWIQLEEAAGRHREWPDFSHRQKPIQINTQLNDNHANHQVIASNAALKA